MAATDGISAAAPDFPEPATAYASAPGQVKEIGWVAGEARRRPFGTGSSREYWLRKAALVDRIALEWETTHSPEAASDAAQSAADAALQLIEFDELHGQSSGQGTIRFSDAIVCAGYRAYVRKEYLAWISAQRS